MVRFRFVWFTCAVLCLQSSISHGKPVSKQLAEKRKLKLVSAFKTFKKTHATWHLDDKPINVCGNKTNTPTLSYLSRFEQQVEHRWHQFKKHKSMIDRIIDREKQHDDDYYVFYHAHIGHLRVVHDLVKELYRFFFLPQSLQHFEFLRYWGDVKKTRDAKSFLTYHKNIAHNWNFDDAKYIAKQILSVNLSLFGNRTYGGECTFEYFLWNSSCAAPWLESYLEKIFKRLRLNTNFVKELTALQSYFQGSEGQLVQIFIPKDKVDLCAYLSRAWGVPQGPLSGIANKAYNSTLKRHTSIKPVLDMYKQKPHTLNSTTFDQLQARLVFYPQVMLNPEGGVKMYRYCTLAKNKLDEYQKKLSDIVSRALKQWCDQEAYTASMPYDLKGSAIDTMLAQVA